MQWGHPIYTSNVAFQEGRPLIKDIIKYIYVKIHLFMWPFNSDWPLIRVASQKRFYCYMQSDCLGGQVPAGSDPG